MAKDEKDLTYRSSKRRQPLKEASNIAGTKTLPTRYVVLPNGTIKEVPYRKWAREVIKNPNGPTADLARKQGINIPKAKVINRKMFQRGNRVNPEKIMDATHHQKIQPVRRTNLTYSSISPEAAKRRGFMSAEEGKAFGQKTSIKKKPKKKDRNTK